MVATSAFLLSGAYSLANSFRSCYVGRFKGGGAVGMGHFFNLVARHRITFLEFIISLAYAPNCLSLSAKYSFEIKFCHDWSFYSRRFATYRQGLAWSVLWLRSLASSAIWFNWPSACFYVLDVFDVADNPIGPASLCNGSASACK